MTPRVATNINLIEGELEELYDLNKDPEELNNLALKPRHSKRLAGLRAKAPRNCVARRHRLLKPCLNHPL